MLKWKRPWSLITSECDLLNYSSHKGICRYTEHTPVSLAQQWDQLRQMVMRLQHNLEQQIQARYNMTNKMYLIDITFL